MVAGEPARQREAWEGVFAWPEWRWSKGSGLRVVGDEEGDADGADGPPSPAGERRGEGGWGVSGWGGKEKRLRIWGGVSWVLSDFMSVSLLLFFVFQYPNQSFTLI